MKVASTPDTPPNGCCFEWTAERLAPYDEQKIVWDRKSFVKDRAWCFFYMPLNFGQALGRACKATKEANRELPMKDVVVLSDMSSRWSTRIYLAVKENENKDEPVEIPNAEVVQLSGTYYTKNFEGEYSQFGQWIKEMTVYVQKELGPDKKVPDPCEWYAFYTTCPKCAKSFGKNNTILFVPVPTEE